MVVAAAAQTHSILGFVHDGLTVVVGFSRECVADLLSVGLLALRLGGTGSTVGIAFELIAQVLSGGFLGIGLECSFSLVRERLTS